MSIWPAVLRKTSGAVAKKRLKLLLLSDKTDFPPELLDKMKDDMIRVISKYTEMEADGIEIQILGPFLQARIPLRILPTKRYR
ncbi:MAG: cell division topological specificity factor MinE [Lachnospiraceae bacterium]|jgi:cell division topological specificity factor